MRTITSPPRAAFLFRLDLRSGVPVYRQVIDQVRSGIATGSLVAGDQLPTVRQLAVDLAINPNTVVRAYRELELGGLLETHQGTGPLSVGKGWPRTAASASATWPKSCVILWLARGPPALRLTISWSS